MEPLGDHELISIFEKLDNKNDRKSFYQVSKQFMKVACIRLKYLHISFPDVLKDILLPNLVEFRCDKPLSNTYMKLLARSSPNLQYLYLESAQDIDLQNADYKEGLDFCECNKISDAGVFYLKELCCLSYLNLSKCGVNVTDTGVEALTRNPNFKMLDLSWLSSITNISLCEIACKCLKLRSINLSGCKAISGEAIGESNSLKYVSLKGCLITDLGLEYLTLGNLKNSLTGLNLCECDRISDAGIFYLKELCCLIFLNLSKCGVNVTDSGAVALTRIPNIEILDMSWLSSITKVSLCEIASKCLKLKRISLSGCEAISGEGLRVFAYHPTLRSLTLLSCHNISLEDVESVVVTWTGMGCIYLSRSMKAQMTLYNRIRGPVNLCRVSWI
nr:hypothetical protein [Tanacetum cinerariifolium]